MYSKTLGVVLLLSKLILSTAHMTVQIHKRAFADCNVINADSIVVAVDVTELEANSTLNSESFFPITLRIFFLSWTIY